MLIDPDVRLAAAAGGVARYLADAAGLDNGAVSALQTETVAACSKGLQQLAETNQRVAVTVTRSAGPHRSGGQPAGSRGFAVDEISGRVGVLKTTS